MSTNESTTKQQLKAGLAIMVAVTEAVREAREIPSGTIYATLMGRMDINAYEKMLAMILNTGLVEKRGDLLRWTGPMIQEAR